jgi:hypothetical protein
VLGMHNSLRQYVSTVSKFTEEIYKESNIHISEQIAHALVLDAVTNIKSADSFVLHYWKKKNIIDSEINHITSPEFINLSLTNRMKYIRNTTKRISKSYLLLSFQEDAINALRVKRRDVAIKSTIRAVGEMLKGKGDFNTNRKFIAQVAAGLFS